MLDGADGSNARLYMLEPSTLVIKKSSDNRLSPAAVTFSAYYRDGTGTERTAYSGRFLIAESTDGTNFTNKYTSSADEAAKTYSPSAASKALKCTLYAGGGTSRALDVQTVVILTDIDNLEISGRNLLQGSGTSSEIAGTGAANTVGCQYELTVPSSAIQGKQTVFACEWAYEGNTPAGTFYWQTVGTTNASVTSPVTIASGKVSGQIQQAFTPAASGSFTALRVRTDGVKGKLVIRNPRLYLGMKDIGWTPAPEDFDAAVGGVKSSIKGLETKVDNSQNSITNKIWQTDVDKSIKAFENSTVTTIENRVTETEKSISGISDTVSKVTTKLTEKADNSIVQELKENYTTLEKDATQFKLDVAEKYAEKSSLNDYTNTIEMNSKIELSAKKITSSVSEEIDAVKKNITTITQKAGEIQFSVEQTQEKVAEVEKQTSEFIIGTQTAVTGAWTGTASFSKLSDGQQITYWLPFNGSGNATLDLKLSDGTSTGAVNCYYSGTTRLTTHYSAGSTIRLTYRNNITIGTSSSKYTGWWADANYNTDTIDRTKYSSPIKAKSAITSGKLIVSDSSGYFPITAGASFDINKQILWAGGSIAAGETGTNNYLMYSYVNLSTTKSGWTGTQFAPVYLVGTLTGTIFTISNTVFTTTVPTTVDNLVYILLGQTYSTTNIVFVPEHPMFRYVTDENNTNGAFKSFEQIAYDSAVVGAHLTATINGFKAEVKDTYATNTSLTNKLNALEIGVRNLQQDSEHWGIRAFLNKLPENENSPINDGILTVPLNSTAWITHNVIVSQNETYTISFDIKSTASYKGNTILIEFLGTAGSKLSSLWISENVTSSWKRLSKTFTIPASAVTMHVVLCSSAGYINSYRYLKIEKGDKATPWCPAVEDISTSISSVELRADGHKQYLEESIEGVREISNKAASTAESNVTILESVKKDIGSLNDNTTKLDKDLSEYISTTNERIDTSSESIQKLTTQLNGKTNASEFKETAEFMQAVFEQYMMGELENQSYVKLSANGIEVGDNQPPLQKTVINKEKFSGFYDGEETFCLAKDELHTTRVYVKNGIDLNAIKYVSVKMNGIKCIAHVKSGGSS